ncbi:MAG: response regulator transcription factor [Spirochaetales bacterium]|nr:response regulator transcription factor [Spirochaetales bacterium]
MSIRILLADDDPFILESLKIILDMDEDFKVVSCVGNGRAALDACLKSQVDVAMLDIRMPEMNGVEAAREITRQTDTKVLILTTFDEDEYIREAIKYGAEGYLLKNNPPEKIKAAIKSVHGGFSVIQNNVLDKLRGDINSGKVVRKVKACFTERETGVVTLVAEGLSNREIAEKLFITEGTVKNYITSILLKTGLRHRTQIAISYLKNEI